jgi:branched-chain amino acid transport system ATP-binding protein
MLKVQGLNVFYGAIQALYDVDLEVREKSLVTIIGANGAGKTTLMKTVSGLVEARRGNIFLEDLDIRKMPAHQRARKGISLVPEGRMIFPDFTVKENLMIGVYGQKNRERLLKEELPLIYQTFPILEERSKQRAGTLSGGQQQMLAVGRALVSRPRLMMLDEPSMGLSPIMQTEVRDTLLKMKSQGMTILLVEQNAALAMAVAYYVYLLEVGKIVEHGPIDRMRENPRVKEAYLGGN